MHPPGAIRSSTLCAITMHIQGLVGLGGERVGCFGVSVPKGWMVYMGYFAV